MAACQGCEVNYFAFISRFFENNDAARDLLRCHGVLPQAVNCPRCQKACNLTRDRSWRCYGSHVLRKTKKRRFCGFSVSDFKGTFLEHSHLPPWKIVVFVNHFLSKDWDHETVIKCLGISRSTSVDWRSFCSEVTDFWFGDQESIGGDGIIVEIDETLIVKRKYEKGHVLSQMWLLGGIERVSKKKFVVPLVGPVGEERDVGTLLPLILKYVRPGSVVISDQWCSCHKLSEHGYQHYMINHTENSIDPEQCMVHTQNIEQLWHDLKDLVKRPGLRSNFLYQYLARYLFIEAYGDQSLHFFFTYAGKLYPPGGTNQRGIPVPADEASEDE